MDASITSLTLETKSMRSDIAGFQSRVTGLEQRMGSLETQINTSQEREQDFLYLRSKLTDMKDRSRRDNIRLLGIPEHEEGKRLSQHQRLRHIPLRSNPQVLEYDVMTYDIVSGHSKRLHAVHIVRGVLDDSLSNKLEYHQIVKQIQHEGKMDQTLKCFK
ncbi:hypothetical protein NDU88_011955 [Pleurodeles waltl]|uniref:Uncharacterized protein n=1 Tax=Pleurodeles waltl TaxID=8319 RepID=A0AAV7S8C5_PLEWA|nr:hypothetical protein NDU88_011955 [Pleurodeles waltl]